MSNFFNNINVLFALSKEDEEKIFAKVGMHPKTKYMWKKREPLSSTGRRFAEYFIQEEGYPPELFDDGKALFEKDFPKIIKICLSEKFQPSYRKSESHQIVREEYNMVAEPMAQYGRTISKDEMELIPRLRKTYGSALSKPVIDRICDLLAALGIDSPMFTVLLDFVQRRPK